MVHLSYAKRVLLGVYLLLSSLEPACRRRRARHDGALQLGECNLRRKLPPRDDSGGGARRRRSLRRVWQGRRLDGRARSAAVDLLGFQPARLQPFPDGRHLRRADHLRNGARASCSKVSAPHGADGERRRLHSAEPRSLERDRCGYMRQRDCAWSAKTLAFSQPQTSARRPARPGARSTTWPGVPVTTRRMLDQSKTTARSAIRGWRRSFLEACPKPWLRYPNVCK
jgi:hypothetical protein